MTEHNLSVREAVSLVVTMTCAKVFLGVPRALTEQGATAAWLVALISALYGPLMWAAVRGIVRRYPGKSLVTATEAVMGPFFGLLINLIYFSFFAFLSVTVIREFSEGMAILFLPTTPVPVLILILLGTSVYIAHLGIEAAGRTAWLGGPFMLAGYAALAFASLRTHAEPNALAPYWGTGPAQVALGGLSQNLLSDLLLLGVIVPSFRAIKQLDRAFLWSILLSGLILVSTEIIYLYVFPWPSARNVTLPLMQVTRAISLGPGLQRVESLFFVIWLVGSVMKVAAAVYGAASTLAQTLRLPSYRHLFFPLGSLMFSFAVLPRNMAVAIEWDQTMRQYGVFATAMLPCLVWVVASVRKRGNRLAAL